MLQLPNPLPKPNELEPDERMFVHTTKPHWGVGLWVREERTRRRMRFEDGEMRAFKKGFYHLLRPVDPERDDLDDLFEALADEHELAQAHKAEAAAKKERPPVMSFEDQVRVFHHLYPGGFQSQAYIDAARGTPDGSYYKRHVDEEVEMAGALLSKPSIQGMLAHDDHQAVMDAMIAILKRTTLVKPAKGHKLLAKITDPEDQKTLALALYRLLYGQKRFRKRFKVWVESLRSVLGKEPAWTLATVFPALVHPDEHVCVKRRAFGLQAREVKPGTLIRKTVNRRGYRRARRIARATRKRLMEAGEQPRDLLDVRRFMWDTLRPKGQKVLEEELA